MFRNRTQAGRVLAERLRYLREHDPVVLGIANGGVVVAQEIAQSLDAPLNALVVRKLAAPGYPDLAMGAVGDGAVIVSNHDMITRRRITALALADAAHREHAEVARRTAMYHRSMPAADLTDRVVVLVDDGIATGATVRVAIRVLRVRGVSRIVLAVPVAPSGVLQELSRTVDQVICPKAGRWLRTVHHWYVEFPDVTDREVIAVLREQAQRVAAPSEDTETRQAS